jgi:hypothetical protein
MRLSDVMSAAGLQSWAEAGLVISFIAFVAIVIYLFAFRPSRTWETARNLPLSDGHTSRSRQPVDGSAQIGGQH